MFARPNVRRRMLGLVFMAALATVFGFAFLVPLEVDAQTSPTLGTAVSVAVLASSAVTNTGPSVINGDVDVSPGSAVTGFPPGIVNGGTIHAADANASQAQSDVTTAYNALAGESCTGDLTGQDLGGLTLTAGVYCFSSSAQLTGTLTLNAQGDPNAVFIFQIGTSTLTTASTSSDLITNAGVDCNVWWQVGTSATLGTATSFQGNILALADITLTTGATLNGRALARTGAVTLDSNTITPSVCATPVPGLTLTVDDGGSSGTPGGVISYTISYQNSGTATLTNVVLTNPIPTNTTFNLAGSTPGWNTGVSPATFDLGTLLPGASGTVVFSVRIDDGSGGSDITNTTTITSGVTTVSASDTTPVVVAPPPPVDEEAPPQEAQPAAQVTAQPAATAVQNTASNTSVPAVAGLPNTGGGAPQATYWMGEHR